MHRSPAAARTFAAPQFGLPDGVEILANDWGSETRFLDVLPGDLSKFALNKGPRMTRLSRFHPFRSDSNVNAGGGLVYFDEFVEPGALAATLQLMGVDGAMRDYALFAGVAERPAREGYLHQLRFVSHRALADGFFTPSGDLSPQPACMLDVVTAFISGERGRWNSGDPMFSLDGMRGGDGDSAKESLGFGVLVEETEWRIYRIWSRAWLVTK